MDIIDQASFLSLADHLGAASVVLEWIVVAIELFAIAILVLGVVRFTGWFVSGAVMRRDAHARDHQLNHGRLALGRHILAGLEVLIVADLIRTMLYLTLANIILLGALVVIRTVVSVSLEYEMRALEKE